MASNSTALKPRIVKLEAAASPCAASTIRSVHLVTEDELTKLNAEVVSACDRRLPAVIVLTSPSAEVLIPATNES